MELIEKTLRYGGREEQVYFKELTAGQQLNLARGQKYRTTQKEGGVLEFDLGDQLEKNYKLVQLTLVKQDGSLVYPRIDNLLQESKSKVAALVKLANEVHQDEDDAGKS